jgi:hypothetical protein
MGLDRFCFVEMNGNRGQCPKVVLLGDRAGQ